MNSRARLLAEDVLAVGVVLALLLAALCRGSHAQTTREKQKSAQTDKARLGRAAHEL
jgi:hypothetical protein